jgi:hypothetical protein
MGTRRRPAGTSPKPQSSGSPRVQRVLRWASGLACLGVALLASADAQPAPRGATNLAALLTYPRFYHLRPILVVGTVAQQQNGEFHVSDDTRSVRVIPEASAPDGVNEVRGVFWDVGRLRADDPRLAGFDLRKTFGFDPDGPWPRPGEVMAVMASAISPAPPPPAFPGSPGTAKSPAFPAVPIRSIVLDASRYLEERVTITGQYYGRNLTGDLPDAPGQTRYDFVLRSADASIWVTGLRPRGRDAQGRNFEFGLDRRLDTGRWLRISGTVREGRGLLWIEGHAGSLALAEAPTEIVEEDEEVPVRVPAAPPPEVIFSAPTEEEIDVSTATSVRIQFSRDIDPATFKGRIRATYLEQPGQPGAAAIQPGDFTFEYRGFNRVLELRFVEPLERFRTLKLELLEGILGTDEQPLKPFTLTFLLGDS